MKARLVNSFGNVKEVKVGFSWTFFFFGFFVPLLRGDFKWAILFVILTAMLGSVEVFSASLIGIIFSFMYNKLYTKDLLKKGYSPSTDSDVQLLRSKGYL